jgi:hypothetical protein
MLKIKVAIICCVILAGFDCGGSGASNSNTATNTNGPVEIKLDPKNMPPGLSTMPITLPSNGKMPAGISINSANVVPGKAPTPGIPNPETYRRPVNINAPPAGPIMMKDRRKLAGKPQ